MHHYPYIYQLILIMVNNFLFDFTCFVCNYHSNHPILYELKGFFQNSFLTTHYD